MPDNFNYGSYRRYNLTPQEKVAEARNTIPLHDSSSDGHFSRDSHLSVTTSDDDGVFSDSDNGFNVGGALKTEQGNIIFTRQRDRNTDADALVANFEFDSVSDNDDGYTDSLYRFSNSTSDRGEVTDPATDSAIYSDAPDVFFKEELHGEHGTGHVTHDHTSGIPDAYDYTNLHAALWALDHRIGNKGGVDDYGIHHDGDTVYYDRWGHMAFSPEWEDCVDCSYGAHPDHRHHALDHPDTHDHTHDLVDEYGWPLPKVIDHSHEVKAKATPPEENLQNAAIARQYNRDPEPWLTADEVPDVTPHPDHRHHVLDHDDTHDHFHDFATRNLALTHGEPLFEEPDHTHDVDAKPTPPPESRELAKFYMDGFINPENFDQYIYEDAGVFPKKKNKPAPEDLYYAHQARLNYNTKFDRPNPDFGYGNEFGRPQFPENYLDGVPYFPEDHRGSHFTTYY